MPANVRPPVALNHHPDQPPQNRRRRRQWQGNDSPGQGLIHAHGKPCRGSHDSFLLYVFRAPARPVSQNTDRAILPARWGPDPYAPELSRFFAGGAFLRGWPTKSSNFKPGFYGDAGPAIPSRPGLANRAWLVRGWHTGLPAGLLSLCLCRQWKVVSSRGRSRHCC